MSTFQSVARLAIRELITERTKESKFGYFLTEEDLRHVVESLLGFVETSRSVRAAGDRVTQQSTRSGATRAPRPRPVPGA